jgi:hypothetical protein
VSCELGSALLGGVVVGVIVLVFLVAIGERGWSALDAGLSASKGQTAVSTDVSGSPARVPPLGASHRHVWPDRPRSQEETNRQVIGIFQCAGCGDLERRVLQDLGSGDGGRRTAPAAERSEPGGA